MCQLQFELQVLLVMIGCLPSLEEGGAGSEDSETVFNDETGETTTYNPDGSTTVVAGDGTVYTTPQQNSVDNPNASSNQSNPYPDP